MNKRRSRTKNGVWASSNSDHSPAKRFAEFPLLCWKLLKKAPPGLDRSLQLGDRLPLPHCFLRGQSDRESPPNRAVCFVLRESTVRGREGLEEGTWYSMFLVIE